MRRISLLFFVFFPGIISAQFKKVPTRQVVLSELHMKTWPKDSSAKAVVLNELGQSYIDVEHDRLIFSYYAKIKILTQEGLEESNFTIPLGRDGEYEEVLKTVWAAAYTLENGSMKVTELDPKAVFTEKNKNVYIKKFAVPNVKVGSVIEVQYTLESPFLFNFRSWEFQGDHPKGHSEYQVQIPGNRQYAISLRGALKLTKNTSEIMKDCFKYGDVGADCAFNIYAIDNIPAFRDEQYMTSRNNFLSALYFELAETVSFLDGQVHKYTREWKDIEDELTQHPDFGKQIKKASSVFSDDVKKITAAQTDPLLRARAIFDLIKYGYVWDGYSNKYTDVGVKKAYDTKKGNSADINLSLVGALVEADLAAVPVILSTRAHGLVTDAHPVMSEFNYVIAAVQVGDQQYLLDAVDDFTPFGVLPIRCINGKGRIISKTPGWVTLTPTGKYRSLANLELKLAGDGVLGGTMTLTHTGYSAISKRREFNEAKTKEDYIKEMQAGLIGMQISNFTIENLETSEKPVIEKMNVVLEESNGSAGGPVYISPILVERIEKNPFTSAERSYPVDYGAPTEQIITMTLEYPDTYLVEEYPKNALMSLPQTGGRYVFSVSPLGSKLSVTSGLYLNRAVYSSVEYHYLKELYARLIQIQQSQIVFKRK